MTGGVHPGVHGASRSLLGHFLDTCAILGRYQVSGSVRAKPRKRYCLQGSQGFVDGGGYRS